MVRFFYNTVPDNLILVKSCQVLHFIRLQFCSERCGASSLQIFSSTFIYRISNNTPFQKILIFLVWIVEQKVFLYDNIIAFRDEIARPSKDIT